MMQSLHLRMRLLLGYVLLISLFAIAMVAMPSHGATWPTIAFDSYQAADGSYTPLSCGTTSGTACPPIPVGSTLNIVVFVGLDNCDPVTLAYGDGTSDQVNLGGSAGHNFYHTYNNAGDYKLTATFNACSGGQPSVQATITIGGGNLPSFSNVLDYAVSLSVPAASVVGVVFGLASVGLALTPRRDVQPSKSGSLQVTVPSSATPIVIPSDNATPRLLREVSPEERAHFSKGCVDERANLERASLAARDPNQQLAAEWQEYGTFLKESLKSVANDIVPDLGGVLADKVQKLFEVPTFEEQPPNLIDPMDIKKQVENLPKRGMEVLREVIGKLKKDAPREGWRLTKKLKLTKAGLGSAQLGMDALEVILDFKDGRGRLARLSQLEHDAKWANYAMQTAHRDYDNCAKIMSGK